jgi:hypothetical protein
LVKIIGDIEKVINDAIEHVLKVQLKDASKF